MFQLKDQIESLSTVDQELSGRLDFKRQLAHFLANKLFQFQKGHFAEQVSPMFDAMVELLADCDDSAAELDCLAQTQFRVLKNRSMLG